ncbi:MAG: hypothetical protein J4428_02935 [Candidatus Aenigmarchaeota archaeon]|nr:hypothetical protein [Candidatus Aenigmarchaeota archaeon]
MNKMNVQITATFIIILISLGLVLAYNPNTPVNGGRVVARCGAYPGDPNCNGCDPYSGTCTIGTGGRIERYTCNGQGSAECLSNREIFSGPVTLGFNGGSCQRQQLDVYNHPSSSELTYLRDFMIWSSDNCGSPTTTIPPTTTLPPPTTTIPPTTTSTTTTIPPVTTTILNVRPQAIAGTDRTLCAGETTILDGSDSYDLDGYIVSYEWWDDGSFIDNDVVFTYTFPEGVHVVTLKVRDNQGAEGIDTVVITVDCDDDFAIDVHSVDASPSSLDEGEDVTVTGTVTLVEAPNGMHPVTAKLHIDDDFRNSITFYLSEGQSEYVFFIEDTSGLNDGTHTAKITASVDGVSAQDQDTFSVDEDHDDRDDELRVDDFEASPASVCIDQDELVELSVDVELEEGNDNERVEAKFYVEDDNGHFFFVGDDDHEMDVDDRREFSTTFNFDAFDLDLGTHEVKVIVDNDDTETEFSSFRVEDCGVVRRDFVIDRRVVIDQFSLFRSSHCLSVEDLWTDDKLIPGQQANMRARIFNCGSSVENNINTDMLAFKRSYSAATYTLYPSQSRDILFAFNVPKDTEGTIQMKASVYNSFSSDSLTEDFVINDGVPIIFGKKEYPVNICETNTIKFDVLNKGTADDIFTLSVSGESADWFSVLPGQVQLKMNQRKTVEAVVDVPCDVKSGKYGFTLAASGSPVYYFESSLKATKPFKFPTMDLGALLPWLLLFLLLFLLVLFFLLLPCCFPKRWKRCCRHTPVGCFGKHGC